MEDKIKELISKGEGITTEFKSSQTALNKDLFETVCSFSNTLGGYIILGVNDDKEIVGINKDRVNSIKKDYSNRCNNLQQIDPAIVSELNEVIVDGKIVLYAYIEESAYIHRHNKQVFVRSADGDYDASGNFALISKLYGKKNNIYDEDRVLPYISVENDLKSELFDIVRKSVEKNHPWKNMNNLEILKSAKMYKQDKETGNYGVTLAGVMIFGTDEAISNVNPHCYTDAILRVEDTERFDDRDFINTNLLDMYDRLYNFISKYTLNRFALSDDGRQRISAIGIMAREIIVNCLMHRDWMDPRTSRIIIYKDRLICENPNRITTMSLINEDNSMPIEKNPTLSAFFREIGYADNLGTGIAKITNNSIKYSGRKPVFEDSDIFRTTIRLDREGLIVSDDGEVTDLVLQEKLKSYNSLNTNERKVYELLKENPKITRKEIIEMSNLTTRQVTYSINSLKMKKLIFRKGADKNGSWDVYEFTVQ